jgi:4-hydroxy-tetrahydrodipicolinate reductase
MRIAILGYGHMGRELEQVAAADGHEIVIRTDINSQGAFNSQTASMCDVAVEFTGPASAADTILMALSFGVPVVSGSTGWLSRYDEVVQYCLEREGSFLHAPNFSIGVNILSRMNSELARIMSVVPGYSPGIEEVHHTAKLDAPSGTAVMLAGQITERHDGYRGWRSVDDNPPEEGMIPVKSVREGMVPGIHTVTWRSGSDIISLRHEAIDRKGFAQGALMAAKYIATRRGVYTMADVLNLL